MCSHIRVRMRRIVRIAMWRKSSASFEQIIARKFRSIYALSVQVKTCGNPHDLTCDSASSRLGSVMVYATDIIEAVKIWTTLRATWKSVGKSLGSMQDTSRALARTNAIRFAALGLTSLIQSWVKQAIDCTMYTAAKWMSINWWLNDRDLVERNCRMVKWHKRVLGSQVIIFIKIM